MQAPPPGTGPSHTALTTGTSLIPHTHPRQTAGDKCAPVPSQHMA